MKREKIKKYLCLVCVATMLVTTLGGCSSKSTKDEPADVAETVVADKEDSDSESEVQKESDDNSTADETANGTFEGIPSIDIVEASKEAFGADDAMLQKKTEIAQAYYENVKKAVENFDSTMYSYSSDVTGYTSTSDNVQKSIGYSFSRSFIELSEYPDNDYLYSVNTDLTFDKEVEAYQLDFSMELKAQPGKVIKLQERDKKIITSMLSEADIAVIEEKINELNKHLETSADYKELHIIDEIGYAFYVNCTGPSDGYDYTSIELIYSKECSLD